MDDETRNELKRLSFEHDELQLRLKRVGKMLQTSKDLTLAVKYRREADKIQARIKDINNDMVDVRRNSLNKERLDTVRGDKS